MCEFPSQKKSPQSPKTNSISFQIYPNVEVRMKNANYQAESDEEFNVWEEFENEPPVPVKGNHGGRNEKSRKMSSVQKSSLQKPTEASLRRQKEVKKESPVKKVCKDKRDPDAEIQEIFEKITSFQKKTCESLDGLRWVYWKLFVKTFKNLIIAEKRLWWNQNLRTKRITVEDSKDLLNSQIGLPETISIKLEES